MSVASAVLPERPRSWQTKLDIFLPLLIIVAPLAASPPLAGHIVDLPGAKLTNLVGFGYLLCFLSRAPQLWRGGDRIESRARFAFGIYLLLFVIAFVRSIPNLPTFHSMIPETYPRSATEYALSFLVLPVLYASVFPYVLKFATSEEAISRLLTVIGVAASFVSLIVIASIAINPSVLLDPTRGAMAKLMGDVLGLHYNSVGTVFTITGPILLYLALKRGGLFIGNYFLALVAVTLLESRTSLFIFVAASAATLIALGRARTLVAIAPIVGVAAILVMGSLLTFLLTVGVSQHSGFTLDSLLSGREQRIWLPLVLEWWVDPVRFWFGMGNYGILTSYLLHVGVVYGVGVAHNAYLEFFLDNGIVLEIALVASVSYLVVKGWRTGRAINSQIYWVFYLCCMCFLLGCLTGRRFVPEQENALLFPVVAMLINVVRLKKSAPLQRPVPLVTYGGH